MNKYCITCHNEKLKTAGLLLDKLDVENVPAGAETWEKVIRKLRGSAMPPPGLPRPDQAFYNDFPAYLETAIDRAAFAKPNPGRPAVHRLNRAEYANAIHDLLDLDIDGASFLPVDDSGYGFDNIGDVLSVSPVLLERYLSAARKISRLAIGDPAIRPADVEYDAIVDLVQETARMSEDLPLGSRGGMTVRHTFPADGEYVIKVRLKKMGNMGEGSAIRGVALKRQLDLRLDDTRLKLFAIGAGANDAAGSKAAEPKPTGFERYAGDIAQQVRLGLQDSKQADFESKADAGLEVRVPVKAGPHVVGAAFLMEDDSKPESTILGERAIGNRLGGKNNEPWVVSTVTISGPYDTMGLGESPSRRRIFVCHPADGEPDENCARTILSVLARRAYRRPINDQELQDLIGFYDSGRKNGGFESGIEMALERILVSLPFLARIEMDPANIAPGSTFRISDLELASRLSFFLWSTLPDDQLLDLAERGKLKDPGVMEQQVQRMLRDPRSKSFVSNFFGQWLQLRHLEEVSPDRIEFPYFEENLRQAFRQETELFLESMLREDRPLMELLDANYTFVNERLAKHYGIPNIYGSSFRRIVLTDDNRKGLLGQGSILSITSYPTRTSVVMRGKWLLENILGTPPPPPPPNVPALKDRGDDGRIKSVREAMEAHRANPVCASCHLRMDPLGFALENFDATGKWRSTEGDADSPIDSSGALPDGTKFQGPAELRKVLMSKPDQFATTVIEKLLTYAMGRGVEYYDEPSVRKIKREAAASDYRWSSLILGIVNSEPFQMRRSSAP